VRGGCSFSSTVRTRRCNSRPHAPLNRPARCSVPCIRHVTCPWKNCRTSLSVSAPNCASLRGIDRDSRRSGRMRGELSFDRAFRSRLGGYSLLLRVGHDLGVNAPDDRNVNTAIEADRRDRRERCYIAFAMSSASRLSIIQRRNRKIQSRFRTVSERYKPCSHALIARVSAKQPAGCTRDRHRVKIEAISFEMQSIKSASESASRSFPERFPVSMKLRNTT